ncbi:CTP synthase [Helicobacter sp. MIT 14-3879]|uniref:CTP synthase n=1 Tax=Helicobacter sp. MIT 14-3879 TaxID=2040649 RepID=UPI000E1F2708|nr:CTP synthase [Helicobacter sp. MIT 14-3879]RDU65048.1 CTP synthetase [Helicobacter sp. MIT 14-3879]
MQSKYIFVTGGVLSSLGKGISSSSIATLIKHANYKVSILKIDPYINVDPGTMSPLEHGEVFVTYDGAETDLDLGHYERFLDINLSSKHNFTTGQIYLSVIEKERAGFYLGKTIQIVPHIVDEIKHRIKEAGGNSDFLIVELGGTIGDIEGMPYLEAMRQLKHELGTSRVISIHVTLIPLVKAAGELKTKPTQHSVQELRRIGISPQIILARCEKTPPKELKQKLSLSCDVDDDCVIVVEDSDSIYKVPINLARENILTPIARYFNMPPIIPKMQEWDLLVKKIISPNSSVKIAFVGKYLNLKESYKSLIEALTHSGAHTDTKINIKWIDSSLLDSNNIDNELNDIDGILIPGGFGKRGVEGKILATKYARENNIPFLGICLGMQLAIIEFARNVLEIKDANSTEFSKDTKNPVIYLIEDFIDNQGKQQFRTHNSPMGGTMRLGEYICNLKKNTKIFNAYKTTPIKERHRHRYEANINYRGLLEENGMIISGESNSLIETIELKNHPWFVGVQFHPEFTSKLQNPNPIILEFIKQAKKQNEYFKKS